jgi:hypothetical protein
MGGLPTFLVLVAGFLLAEAARVGATVWLSHWTGVADMPGEQNCSWALPWIPQAFQIPNGLAQPLDGRWIRWVINLHPCCALHPCLHLLRTTVPLTAAAHRA